MSMTVCIINVTLVTNVHLYTGWYGGQCDDGAIKKCC